MTHGHEIAVAILAGGEGSRMGGGKPMVRLGGRTLIERAFDRARGWSSRVVVAVRRPDQLGPSQLPCIEDAAGIDGPLAGLASALEWSSRHGAECLLTIPCDMPFLPEDLPRRLLDGIGDRRAAIASSGGELHPVCGVWRNAAVDELPKYYASGRGSLRGFAQQLGFAEVEWPTTPHDPFFNINRPADLAIADAMVAG